MVIKVTDYASAKQTILDLYKENDVCLQELLESGKIEIVGLPLYLQVLLYCELKEEIDRDTVIIQSEDFDDCNLTQYLGGK